jgi:myo-inositol 2-dehydrogenase / D-chiro-inositol 1-dehydrogenase
MKPGPDRRTFLSGSAAALAAAALGSAQQSEIRTAIIGVGVRGSSLLRQVMEQANVKVAAICDTDPTALDAAMTAAASHNPRSFTDYRQVLDLKDVEAVYIATPCDLHTPMSIAALEAGKYVYCEKPLGVTPEQVQLAWNAARKAGTFLQIGQQLRYMPGIREAIRQVHEQRVIGQPFVIKAQRHSTPPLPGKERKRPAWYLDVKRSGDLIVENAVHNLDVCNWIAGSLPVSAYGHGKKYLPKPEPAGTAFMDGFSVMYVYENDVELSYSQLYLHPRKLKELANGQWYLIFGEKGTFDLSNGLLYEMYSESEPAELVPAAVRDANENAVEEFFACIRERRKPFADIRVGATGALTAILGREAIYRRRMVTWKELGVELG